MNRLDVRLNKELSPKVSALMKERKWSGQRAGEFIIEEYFRLIEEMEKPNKKRAPVKRFVKPVKEELERYFYDQGSMTCQDDAAAFLDHYDSNGWKVGKAKTPMVDWKASVRNWIRRGKENGQSGSKAALTNLNDTDF